MSIGSRCKKIPIFFTNISDIWYITYSPIKQTNVRLKLFQPQTFLLKIWLSLVIIYFFHSGSPNKATVWTSAVTQEPKIDLMLSSNVAYLIAIGCLPDVAVVKSSLYLIKKIAWIWSMTSMINRLTTRGDHACSIRLQIFLYNRVMSCDRTSLPDYQEWLWRWC